MEFLQVALYITVPSLAAIWATQFVAHSGGDVYHHHNNNNNSSNICNADETNSMTHETTDEPVIITTGSVDSWENNNEDHTSSKLAVVRSLSPSARGGSRRKLLSKMLSYKSSSRSLSSKSSSRSLNTSSKNLNHQQHHEQHPSSPPDSPIAESSTIHLRKTGGRRKKRHRTLSEIRSDPRCGTKLWR